MASERCECGRSVYARGKCARCYAAFWREHREEILSTRSALKRAQTCYDQACTVQARQYWSAEVQRLSQAPEMEHSPRSGTHRNKKRRVG